LAVHPRLKILAALSLPATVTLVAQNLLGVLTTAIVGRLGDAALAGVGIGTLIFSILLALLFGLDTGVQAIVARRTGSGDRAGAGAALAQGLRLCGLAGALLTGAAYVVAPALLALAIHDPAAVAAGTAFLHGFSPILLVLGFNMTFSAYWYGVGAPRYALAVTAIQTPLHGLMSYLLTFGGLGLPALGAFGAGLGATLAAVMALAVHLILVLKIAPVEGLRRGAGWSDAGSLLSIGLPLSLQQSLLYISLALQFAVVARISTAAVAAVNVINTLATVAVLAACGVGTAAATLVGEALGRRDAGDARRWGWEGAAFATVALAPFCVALVVAPGWALGLFITNPDTIVLAEGPTRILALSMSFDTFGRILTYGLRGAGSTAAPSAVSFAFQWLVMLPLSWWVAVKLGFGLNGAMLVLLGRSVAEAAVMAWLWRGRSWMSVRIPVSAPALIPPAAQPAG
jgi:MATE family multidrug resistance protein